jgi:hypothetical protein
MEELIKLSKEVSLNDDANSVKSSGTATSTIVDPVAAANELKQLSTIITNWKEITAEMKTMNEQVREKRKRLKVMEEMILRIMKKHNIGALDLKGSGGRILYRRSSSKSGMNDKVLFNLLSEHMKSETSAAAAVKYINEHRDTKAKESLVYEKD